MKISVNDVELFTLSEVKENVIKSYIHSDQFEDFLKTRIEYAVMKEYDICLKKLKTEWDAKLYDEEVETAPICCDAYARVIFAHDDYKDKARRDAEAAQGE